MKIIRGFITGIIVWIVGAYIFNVCFGVDGWSLVAGFVCGCASMLTMYTVGEINV